MVKFEKDYYFRPPYPSKCILIGLSWFLTGGFIFFSSLIHQVTEEEKKALGHVCTALMFPFSSRTVRIVTHNNISDSDVDLVSRKLQYVIDEMAA